MPVRLNANDIAVAWGEQIAGEDIPNPPESLITDGTTQPKWDRTNEEWVPDPDYAPPTRLADRVEALEDAAGVGDEPAKRGIAKRIDELEDRIAALEDKHA